jgi:RNA polymerase primary sigma factor/RNA polymerase sigma factor
MIRSGHEEDRVCGPMPDAVAVDDRETGSKRHAPRSPEGLPPYLAQLYDRPLLTPEQELHLFRKMNYLKYKAAVLRDSLNPDRPSTRVMLQIEQFYNEALETKNEIVSSNLRLVVSIAKRHVNPLNNLFELISDGNLSLIHAVEKFDYTRGNRFSTYATWAVMRNYARALPGEKRYHEHYLLTDSDIFETAVDERADASLEERIQLEREDQVDRFLQELDEREQHIIVNRFGLRHDVQPQTLRQVGDEIGVTKERVRQIEVGALAKLRKAAESELLDIPGLE